MDKKTKIWIVLMEIASKYWGCHQIQERSFFFRGYQFPVCARCTGIILGDFIAIILLIAKIHINIWISAALLLPMIVDGGIQYLFKIYSNNYRRLFSGMAFGIGFVETVYFVFAILL